MTAACLLGLTVSLSATTARGDGELAAASARFAADPDDGAACLVLGVARFRAEKYAEALEVFDRCGDVGSPPEREMLGFNRGSALLELARYDEAERAFVRVAEVGGDLSQLAILNAGVAALELKAWSRALEYADRAAKLPGADELGDVIGDLREEANASLQLEVTEAAREAYQAGRHEEAVVQFQQAIEIAGRWRAPTAEVAELHYELGMSHYRAGQRARARRGFDRAAALEPGVPEFHFMAARAAYVLSDDAAARSGFLAAIDAGLQGDSHTLARDYLDALSRGLPAEGRGLSVVAVTDVGYDSNVGHSGSEEIELFDIETVGGGSAVAGVNLELAYGMALGSGFTRVAYDFDQVYFFASEFDEFRLQEHDLSVRYERALGDRARIGADVGGELLFSGVDDLTTRHWGLRAGVSTAIDEGEWGTTSVRLEQSLRRAPEDAYEFLAGSRTQLRVSQTARTEPATFHLSARLRKESIGTENAPVLVDTLDCAPDCEGFYVIPYSYGAGALSATAVLRLLPTLRLDVNGGVEWRRYDDESYAELTTLRGTTQENVERRRDRRLVAGAALKLAATPSMELSLRYDLVNNTSTVDDSVDPLDYDNMNYTKHMIAIVFLREW